MDPDPDRNVGCTDLSGKSDSALAAPVIVATPAVTHPGAGPSSAMVTRSRARGGREINVEPEVEFGPEMEFLPEVEIPAETDEEVSGATRHITDIASQYIPEATIPQEVTTSASITTSTLPPIPRNLPHHICIPVCILASLIDIKISTKFSEIFVQYLYFTENWKKPPESKKMLRGHPISRKY